MRRDLLVRLQRIFVLVSLVALLGAGVLVAQAAGYRVPGIDLAALLGIEGRRGIRVALVAGHAGFDSGAVCTDGHGNTLLTEAEVNARIAHLVAERLRAQGIEVLVLEERDPRMIGLVADVLLSLHADSCVPLSGYKVATRPVSLVGQQEARLLDCIHTHYPALTGLVDHPETITRDMTGYHAFRKIAPTTPAAILEMGFLGGDASLLVEHPTRVAEGVVQSLLCFLRPPSDQP